MSNNNEIQLCVSDYVKALNDVLGSTIKKFAIIILISNLIWGFVFSFFIYNAFYSTDADCYNMEQSQPNQTQIFNKGVNEQWNSL